MTPVAHSAIGLLGWERSSGKKNWFTLLCLIMVSNLPDIDFVFYFFRDKAGWQVHQSFTHNVFFVGLSVLVLFLVFKTIRERMVLMAVAYSHLLLDLIILDRVRPVGIRLFYPLSGKWYNFGFFPNFLRGDLQEILSWHNVVTISLEIIFLVLPVLFICGKSATQRMLKKEFWKT